MTQVTSTSNTFSTSYENTFATPYLAFYGGFFSIFSLKLTSGTGASVVNYASFTDTGSTYSNGAAKYGGAIYCY